MAIEITRDKTTTAPAQSALSQVGPAIDTSGMLTPAQNAMSGGAQLEATPGTRTFGIEGEITPKDGSIDSILGLDRPHHQRAAAQNVDITDQVMNGSPLDKMQAQLDEAVAENQSLKSERGRVGREVVGPLREQIAEMNGRMSAIEQNPQRAPEAPTGPVDPADVARTMFGADVDVTDPAVLRDAVSAQQTFNATEQLVQSALKPVLDSINAVAEQVGAQASYAEYGVSKQDVQKVVAQVPELADLSPVAQASAVRNLLKLGKAPVVPDVGGAAVAHQSPENFIEGSSGNFGGPAEVDPNDARFERFRDLRGAGKMGASKQQEHVFMNLLENGTLN